MQRDAKKKKKVKADNDDDDDDDEESEEQDEQEEQLQEGVKMVRELQNLEFGLDQQIQMEEDVDLLDGMPLAHDDEEEEVAVVVEQDKKSRDLLRLKARVSLALQNINQGASALEVSEQVIATDLHELIYRFNMMMQFRSTVSVNEYDASRYAINNLKTRVEYQLDLKQYFVTG